MRPNRRPGPSDLRANRRSPVTARAAILAVALAFVAGCGSSAPAGSSPSTPTAAPIVSRPPELTSAYPPGWVGGMCAAYGDLADHPIDTRSGAAGREKVASALIALSAVPDWPAGDRARDALIDWYQQVSMAFDLYEDGDELGAIDAQIASLDALGIVGDNLNALEAATGEALPC